MKLRVGLFSFTSDEGCSMIFLELMNTHIKDWEKSLDIRYCKLLKSKNDMKKLDVAFVEGAISTFKEEKRIKEIRKNTKKLVAIGSCATNGAPSNQRNFFSDDTKAEIKLVLDNFGHRDKVSPLNEIVTVDDSVPGCPMDETKFLEILEKYLKEFKTKRL
jgi:coenzyme F420-reducing hydrogenase gamma subunit